MDTQKRTFKLSVATLAIMNITAVVSLRGLPAEAVYGLSSAATIAVGMRNTTAAKR